LHQYTKAVLTVIALVFAPVCYAEKLMKIDPHLPLWEQADMVGCLMYRSHACASTYPKNENAQDGCFSFPKESVYIINFGEDQAYRQGAEDDKDQITGYNFGTTTVMNSKFSIQQIQLGRQSLEFSVTEINQKGNFPALRFLVNIFQNDGWDSVQTNVDKFMCEAHTY